MKLWIILTVARSPRPGAARCGESGAERILPAQSLEACEVHVARYEHCVMAQGERREMRVCREVSRGAAAAQERLQRYPVIILLPHDPDVVQCELGVDFRGRRVGREGSWKYPGIGGESQESEQHDPGKADGVLVVHSLFPPTANPTVLRRVRVHGAEQDIQIDDPHLRSASSRVISSSSSAAASASALSSATRGAPREWTCSR